MMKKKYEHVAELFTLDVNKYSQEEFFRDINKFIVCYKVSWKIEDKHSSINCHKLHYSNI